MTPDPRARGPGVATAGIAAGVGGLVALAVRAALDQRGGQRWRRTNFRGRPVGLAAGPAFVAGALAGHLAGHRAGLLAGFGGHHRAAHPRADSVGVVPGGQLGAAVLLATGAGLLGRLDDRALGEPKGLRGHLAASVRGRPTAGLAKLVGLPLLGLAAARVRCGGPASLRDGLLLAVGANVANLLDVRPGRALKLVAAATLPVVRGGSLAAAVAGTAVALLPADVSESQMLGDCGANPAGALVALAALDVLGDRGRDGALALGVATVLASEVVSLGRLIEAVPGLRSLDRWGRADRFSGPGTARVLP